MPVYDNTKKFIGWLNNYLVGHQARIVQAMRTEAQWEVWLQVEMAVALNSIGIAVREQKYDDSRKSLDILFVERSSQQTNQLFVIELKAESLKTNLVSGRSMFSALLSDLDKMQSLQVNNLKNKYSCSALTYIACGIGSPSKYEAIARKMYRQLPNATATINVAGQYGMYYFVVEK